MIFKKSDHEKALLFEEKGDRFLEKKNYKKALFHFKKSQEFLPDSIGIYDKLIETHKNLESEWSEEDMALSVAWTMKKMELENPKFKRIHAQSEEEWKEVIEKVKQILSSKTEEEETAHIEDIVSYGEKAIYPLIDFILSFKNLKNIKKESSS